MLEVQNSIPRACDLNEYVPEQSRNWCEGFVNPHRQLLHRHVGLEHLRGDVVRQTSP
jgi:hypothetical protein